MYSPCLGRQLVQQHVVVRWMRRAVYSDLSLHRHSVHSYQGSLHRSLPIHLFLIPNRYSVHSYRGSLYLSLPLHLFLYSSVHSQW